MLVHGGVSGGGQHLGDVWSLELATWTWTRVECKVGGREGGGKEGRPGAVECKVGGEGKEGRPGTLGIGGSALPYFHV